LEFELNKERGEYSRKQSGESQASRVIKRWEGFTQPKNRCEDAKGLTGDIGGKEECAQGELQWN
jgi:hypothetical protein